jgi:tetratricopeptide (TPR) repeat protein
MQSWAPLIVLVLGFVAVVPAAAQEDPAAEVKAAEKLIQDGDLAGAIQSLERTVAAAPRSFAARIALGRALDLDGRHAAARRHLEEAVARAPDDARNAALSALGISYAFESKPDEAARYYQRVFDAHVQANDRSSAAAAANALGRIYLESGNMPKAEQWYRTGYETAKQISHQTAARLDLWEMRWHNALGRIEARRGRKAAAAEHAAAVKTLLDKGGNDNQKAFYPYLLGYIAFYSKDYRGAVRELSQGDLSDPFVLGLIAQAHEKLRDRRLAGEYYARVLAIPSHSINAAFARPKARAFLKNR